ncbi:DNA polymerase beta superfamily protein [Pendulispora albinea]|uniref:Nucleotidyltransferase domain-containing protein n=1 Tax=Pendulispora albinea TaxID=2741071 RepID=A0ABZ2LL71_9BACT
MSRSLSRRVHRHYRGFAQNQLRFAQKEPTAKKLLYVLRTALTGIHLIATGELEADLTRLMDRYGLADAAALLERNAPASGCRSIRSSSMRGSRGSTSFFVRWMRRTAPTRCPRNLRTRRRFGRG